MSHTVPMDNAVLAARYDIHLKTPASDRGPSPDIAGHPNDRFQLQCLECGEPVWSDGARIRTKCGDQGGRSDPDRRACHESHVREVRNKRILADLYERAGVIYQELAAAKRAGDEQRATELEQEAARLNVPGFQQTV